MPISTPSTIISLIGPTFDRGRASGDLLFFPSEAHIHRDLGIDFEIRLCPAFLHKPRSQTPHFEPQGSSSSGGDDEHEKEKHTDVFSPPYNPNLYVGELRDEGEGREYVVLLNKYSVIEGHFLLVTKEFRSQTSPLDPSDLVQAYLLLVAAHKAGKHLFAFYNCGDRSGASQPHKHLQLLPIQNEDGPPIERLAKAARIGKEDKPFALPTLPFAHHVRRLNLPTSATPAELEPALAQAFIDLLDLCISTVRHTTDCDSGTLSYNVLLSLSHMYVFPRRCETHTLAMSGSLLSINSHAFAGILLVKSDDELEALIAEGPGNLLKAVTYESMHELQVSGGPEFDGDLENP